jgi:hypothetical protein
MILHAMVVQGKTQHFIVVRYDYNIITIGI